MRATIAIARERPPAVEQADVVAWLAGRLAESAQGRLRIVYSTIAWQHLDETSKARGAAVIEAAGRRARPGRPLAWARFEADGRTPGAALSLDHWDGRHRSFALGRGDFHGRWIYWQAAGA